MTEQLCREREQGQAENATHLRYRHDGETKDKREARDRILSLQAKGWRNEETERETEDKSQRCHQDPRCQPRR